MSIIGVKGVPVTWPINQLQLRLGKRINAPFEAINYEIKNSVGVRIKYKKVYLQLAETLDPWVVIEEINRRGKFKGGVRMRAFLPKNVPDLPLPISQITKVQGATGPPQQPDKVLTITHTEILTELQYKYTQLQELSAKETAGNKLIKNISKTLFERLTHVMEANPDNAKTAFILSKAYRKSHPHFADFQLVLSTLHAIQDAALQPRKQLTEKELMKTGPAIDDIPFARVKQMCTKYATKIQQKVLEHIDGLKCEPDSSNPSPEELTRCRIRTELKGLGPYVGQMVRQVVSANFMNTTHPIPGHRNSSYEDEDDIRMRIYGEPFLPSRDCMEQLTRPIDAKRFVRSDNIFNLLVFTTNRRHYRMLMEYDGKELGGAKLIIRKSEMKVYKPPPHEYNQMMRSHLAGTAHEPEPRMHVEDMEQWNEEW